jgi:hypothetical protein
MKNGRIKRSGLSIVKKKPKPIPNNNFFIKLIESITGEISRSNEEKHLTRVILNWFSYYFQVMEGSGTALVLLGSEKITEQVFWKKVVQPIFGYQYTITINDEILKKDISEIVKEKVFYHIGNISSNDDNKNKLNQLLQAILLDGYILINTTTPEKIPVFGQILITSEQTVLLLKEFYTQFEYIKVQEENEIIEHLQVESIPGLSLKLTDKELTLFSSILSSFYDLQKGLPIIVNSIDTLENKELAEDFNQDEMIGKFIQAIKATDLSYFEKVKELEGGKLYHELKYAFFEMDDKYFIGQDLFRYYNAIYGQSFETNKPLMDILKKEDEMFTQEVKTFKILTSGNNEDILFQAPQSLTETGRKDLYKIKGYKLAKHIIIPYGSILVTSQTNIKK